MRLLRLCGPANEYKHNMSDENMSADAMLALARDHDAGVDIDSQPAEQAQNNNESASVSPYTIKFTGTKYLFSLFI